ncbi:chorismate synthase [Candidatus Kinetoplastidibacterium crithidiae]|uniref:Chorismate synthase n=1 Tax=Candidatus Kinetoplastidibacterium crithidiae TCC036E TaxID=1208918 RepID=M1L442_9PROT|nr:chorismate synthase [Candidatus Kinetoplastibacterium crithidii]AFZ82839.1 chorismate synthase [Candidatus Kinetoplastibacterium crithidii (ex Angomonas deanei ATCC 30255)]AGF47508.1 chorismate synthase [Candidatus Kinetoplastibacterium crithidii TCC036E]
MSGNSLGKLFCVTNFGESHGPAIGCVVDGCPPGMKLDHLDIQSELDRRKPGTSRHVTQRQEKDEVEILSGVYNGVTTGTPIALLIRNIDARSKDYSNIAEAFRPGHADYSYWHKYGVRDPRGGGRSSARLTAPTVAAGAIAKKWLFETYNISISAYMSQLGKISIPFISYDYIDKNPFFSPNMEIVPELENYMDLLRKNGDSIGARIEVVANNVPVGLGEPIYDRLDADIAHIMMGLNAVKAVSIGSGFDCIGQLGSEHGDEITPGGFKSNNSGGILGGISTGQPINVSLAIKPTSSIRVERNSVNKNNEAVVVQTFGRHDPCVGIRAVPIVESMMAIILIDHALRYRGQCGIK